MKWAKFCRKFEVKFNTKENATISSNLGIISGYLSNNMEHPLEEYSWVCILVISGHASKRYVIDGSDYELSW